MKGILRIQSEMKNGRTILKDSYCTQPFKIANITEDKKDHRLRLMLMSSSPGILDNDEYKIEIELNENCNVELSTQSYQRIFQMKTGARQETKVRMKRNSSLIFLPHPAVPHQSSIFSSKNTFYLSEDCLLIWGEVLSCGRKLNGEVFRLSKYHTVTEIFSSGKLVVKENLMLAPGYIDVNMIGQLEGYTHQASFICIGIGIPINVIIDDIHDLLEDENEICFAASALPGKGMNLRILGHKAEQLYSIHQLVARRIISYQNRKLPVKTTAYVK
jgi:urease accessory protein